MFFSDLVYDFYGHLRRYSDAGLITYTDDDPPEPKYSPALWFNLARDLHQSITTMEDYNVLVHEVILARPDGQQYTEDEATIALMECAVGNQSIVDHFHRAIELAVRNHYEGRLIADHCVDLEGRTLDI